MTTITPELLSQFLKTSYLPCQVIHDNPCLLSAFKRFMLNIRTSTKLFLPLYLIPTILMKRKQLKSSAGPILKETMKNCLRTIGFVSTWFALWKYCLCKTKDIRMTVDGIFIIFSIYN